MYSSFIKPVPLHITHCELLYNKEETIFCESLYVNCVLRKHYHGTETESVATPNVREKKKLFSVVVILSKVLYTFQIA